MKTKNIIAVSGESFVLNHGMVESPEPESFPPHIHEAWELLFFLRGDIRYNVLGKSYKLKRGDLVLSRPTVLHRIEPTGSDKYERVNVIFDENMIPESIMKKIPDGVDVFALGAAGRVFDIFLRLSPARGLVMLVFPVRRDGIVCIKKNKSVSRDIGVVITYTAVAYLTVSRSVYQIALSV